MQKIMTDNKHKKCIAGSGKSVVRCFMLIWLSLLCLIFCGTSSFADSYTPVNAVITINCQAVDDIDNCKYKIVITSDDANAPMPDENEVTIDENGKGQFVVKVTEPGTYDYLIYQLKGNDSRIDYDKNQYEAHLFVTSNDKDQLEYSVSVNIANTSQKPISIDFENKVTKKESDDPSGKPTTETSTETYTEATTETTTEKSTEKADKEDDNKKKAKKEDGEKSEKADDGGKASAKKTGDNADLFLWISIAVVSFAGIIILKVIKQKM